VNTYSEIVKSPRILDKVSKELNRKYTSTELSEMLTVSNQAESQLLNIDVESKSEENAETIANKIAEVFSDEVPDIMNVDNVSILSTADNTTVQVARSEEHTSELQSRFDLVCRLLLEKKKTHEKQHKDKIR